MWIEGYIFALSENYFFHFMIQKHSVMHAIKNSKCKISNINNWKGKKLSFFKSTEKEDSERIIEKKKYSLKSF